MSSSRIRCWGLRRMCTIGSRCEAEIGSAKKPAAKVVTRDDTQVRIDVFSCY